ncbi:phytanoyl-CoA dioxygenase [Vibrio sp. S9_S30]|uniref:phytanoyl-CoA dioxygenase family protein n=1 Tax=Vibrio sp. S9_S30 TaxID=2720226 RepID=UPI001680454B|nr:phytanoyl-CoA dioxygenase family protein [Vibrio sp. S9_S30]MBD1558227.1 phytanoyl-CoA dioxygenase [Vibrio sp. S9_S30]
MYSYSKLPMFASKDNLSLDDFIASRMPALEFELKWPSELRQGIVIYDAHHIDTENWVSIRNELASIFLMGGGIAVIKNFFSDTQIVDKMSCVFNDILASELGFGEGDHFAQAGATANGRIWNVFQKSALANPDVFIHYYKNPLLKLVSESWLGANYQLTAQVNIVHPGGRAQQSHRDYHLGFQHAEALSQYPVHAQQMSALLTLQGAIAHSDMPLESGPTKLLPYSQHYSLGYIACREPVFQQYFEDHCVQLPLSKGDALFFNPAIVHAAGQNETQTIQRCANLLQISSAFAKPMETVDLATLSSTLFDNLNALWQSGSLTELEKDAILTASADGYAFPTNLDTDAPVGELAPQTMKQLLKSILDNHGSKQHYQDALIAHAKRRKAEPEK